MAHIRLQTKLSCHPRLNIPSHLHNIFKFLLTLSSSPGLSSSHGDAANTMMKVPVLSMSQKLCNGKGVDDDISSDLVSNNIHQVPPGCVRKKINQSTMA